MSTFNDDDPKFISSEEAVASFEKKLENQSDTDFVVTGFHAHDQTLGRLRRSELAFVGARPGMGKTAFLLKMALNQLKAGGPCLFLQFRDAAPHHRGAFSFHRDRNSASRHYRAAPWRR